MEKENNGKGIFFVIPSLNPGEHLIDLLRSIKDYTAAEPCAAELLRGIIIVNDGSAPEYDSFYLRAERDFGCTILRHSVNLGKGRGLKTAFNYILSNFPDTAIGALTLDSDGQHAADDAFACAAALVESSGNLILGVRDFRKDNIPARSRFGNKTTRGVMNAFCGVKVTDTQTGLRAIPLSYMKDCMNISGERFEFEMNMLIKCGEYGIKVKEVPIKTIYLDNNSSSHFNPIVDSVKIYAYFLKYSFVSISSFIIDLYLFSLFEKIFEDITPVLYIYIASVAARLISSGYNYLLNRKMVFNDKRGIKSSIVKYYTLVVANIVVSAVLVDIIYPHFSYNIVLLKLLVDALIFILNFIINKKWIFSKKS